MLAVQELGLGLDERLCTCACTTPSREFSSAVASPLISLVRSTWRPGDPDAEIPHHGGQSPGSTAPTRSEDYLASRVKGRIHPT